MTKTELKHQAQDELMSAMQIAFCRLSDALDKDEDIEALHIAIDHQMARVETLFGYNKYSWARGV